MISRRLFLQVAGVSAFASLLAANLRALQSTKRMYLPLVVGATSGSYRPPTWKQLRIALNYAIGDPTYRDAILDYFAALDFTHVYVWLHFGEIQEMRQLFKKKNGRWVYNDGRYTEGLAATTFQTLKKAVEDRGMQALPAIGSLSHVEGFIELDPTISEFSWNPALDFADQPAFGDYLRTQCYNGNCFGEEKIKNILAEMPLGHIAKVGNNPGMDEIFGECVRIVKSNWGNTPLGGPAPAFWHLGHDELGYAWACCIKADRSKNESQSRSELVAAEISQRVSTIHNEISPHTQVMIYGDSYVPADYGETYGMAGDLQTGQGGVLQILRDRYQIADKLIVLPWAYSFLDGQYEPNGRLLIFDKVKQIAFLDKLGIRYIPCTGEDGEVTFTEPRFEQTKQSTFEWVRASQMYPERLAGYAHLGFGETYFNQSEGIYHDFNACLLAYLAWVYGDRSLRLARHGSYGPRVFSRVKHGKSSQDQQWLEGVHYSRPSLQGSMLTMAGA